jgi:DNA-binding NarL/FixJ family response regulator
MARAGLRLVIESQPGLCVLSEAITPIEAAAKSEPADVVVVNMHMYEGGDVLREVMLLARQKRVILLTDRSEMNAHYLKFGEIIGTGVKGIVLRDDPVESLVSAINRVCAGGVWIAHSALARLLGKMLEVKNAQDADPAAIRAAQLTRRDREIIALISQGMKNKQVAGQLSISEPAVRHRLTAIFDKLGVSDRVELAIYAHQNNLSRLS